MDSIEIIKYLVIFIFGLSMGSFMNVLIYRIPNEMNVAFPPSSCPSCKNRLKWYHNIPVVSWILLRGKCGFCKNPISIRYPLIELLTGFLAVYFMYISQFTGQTVLQSVLTFLFFYLYIAMAFIDFETHMVSDMLNIPAALMSLFLVGNSLQDIAINFAYFIATGIFFYFGIIVLYSKIRGIQVMGEGDVPILMGISAFLHIEGLIMTIFISAITGLIIGFFKKLKNGEIGEIPYIPPLAIGTFISFNILYVLHYNPFNQ